MMHQKYIKACKTVGARFIASAIHGRVAIWLINHGRDKSGPYRIARIAVVFSLDFWK